MFGKPILTSFVGAVSLALNACAEVPVRSIETDGEHFSVRAERGLRGLSDVRLVFSGGGRDLVLSGFKGGFSTAEKPRIDVVGGALRVSWSIPPTNSVELGCFSERLKRIYAGVGNVLTEPRRFRIRMGGDKLSTRHVGVDFANGLSLVIATDSIPDRLEGDGEKGRLTPVCFGPTTFYFLPTSRGAFVAARRFRDICGYGKSPAFDRVAGRMCLDQWGVPYDVAESNLLALAEAGVTNCVFVRHVWQRWGYDTRLPDVFPPAGDRAAFMRIREVCRTSGHLFALHDNFTDLYPDSESFNPDDVAYAPDGTPQTAWFNSRTKMQSFRFAPHRVQPFVRRNAGLIRDAFSPEAAFIDVFAAHPPFDYFDRSGSFYSRASTSASWAAAIGSYRQELRRPDAVVISEGCADHLVGVLDAGESDHLVATRWVDESCFADSERIPWHDIVTHGRMVLLAGGIAHRYNVPKRQKQPIDYSKMTDYGPHGYGSDDYLGNTLVGGRNPMSTATCCRETVSTYRLLHDVCQRLARAELEAVEFVEDDIHRLHSTFSDGSEVWCNRRTNGTWSVSNVILPPYGFLAMTGDGHVAASVIRDGVRVRYTRTPLGQEKEEEWGR